MDIHTKTIANDPFLSDGSESEIIGRLDIEPGEMSSLVLGIYEDDFPQPNFHIETSPDNPPVSSTLVRTDDNGEYKLTYHFQNFQDKPCHLVVRRCEHI
jgi:hypothetical protein